MRRSAVLCAAAFALTMARAGADPPPAAVVTKIEPAEVPRGATIRLSGTGLDKPSLSLELLGADGLRVPVEAPVKAADATWTFSLPRAFGDGKQPIALGRYLLLVYGDDKKPIPVALPQLHVLGDVPGPAKVTTIYPSVSYTRTTGNRLTILGENFSPIASDNHVIVIGRGELPVCWRADEKDTHCGPSAGAALGLAGGTRELVLERIPAAYYTGAIKLQVRVGDVDTAADPVPTVLSTVTIEQPKAIAGLVTAVLFLLVAAVILLPLRLRRHTIDDPVNPTTYGMLATIFIDPSTDTFSLSKLQFYLWLFAVIFAYVYVTAVHTLVQGSAAFVPPPSDWTWLLGTSATTSAAAMGVTTLRGPKGAGPAQASFADFVTTGGMVAPERLQFFLWTFVSLGAFLTMVIKSDPATLQEVPKLPDGFLILMGCSAGGYLGGKVVRKAGPIMDYINASGDATRVKLDINGSGLSQDASLTVGGAPLDMTRLDPAVNPNGKPAVVAKNDPAGDPTVAKILRLVMLAPDASWLDGKPHALGLTNPDGQKAEWSFTVVPPPPVTVK